MYQVYDLKSAQSNGLERGELATVREVVGVAMMRA